MSDITILFISARQSDDDVLIALNICGDDYIKTPIATIKAVCEVLQVTGEKKDTLNKVNVIEAKAEMIDNLIGNMFHTTFNK